MKEIDSNAIKTVGIPSMVLMERAALACVEETEKMLAEQGRKPGRESRILVFCGTGNNGADGMAMARIWSLRGADVTVVTLGDPEHRTGESRQQAAICRELGIPVVTFDGITRGTHDIIVDALFGVGLARNIEGDFATAVGMINERKGGFAVAVDIPSGIRSSDGAVLGCAVKADLTVTFGLEKLGTVFYPGRSHAGRVVVADIGFPHFEGYGGDRFFTFDEGDLGLVPARKPDAHKGTYGKVLVVAGSAGMCGAAYFSALAAYRSGAGLVKILTVRANVPVLQTLIPEAIIESYDPELCEEEPEDFRAMVEAACTWASVIVLGPGLGRDRHVEKMVQYVLLSAYVPIIVDADGLNTIAEYEYLADYFTENVIITPHIGEMARLMGVDPEDIKADPVAAAAAYRDEKGVVCVLKDAVTVVARHDGSIFLGTSGSPAMAKGGSGDVLTGVIAGLLAMDLPEDDAACLGVYLHGLAGTEAGRRAGVHGVLAGEIAGCLALSK